jgi:hypothetical protein
MYPAQPAAAFLAATATAWRQRPLGRQTARAFALAAIFVVLTVTAANALRPANRIDVVSPAATESPSPAGTADAAPASKEPLTADTPLDLYGIGPIEVGMTLAEAEQVAGVNLIPGNFEDFGQRCFFARAKGLEEDFVLILNAPGSEPLDRPEDGIIVTVAAGERTQTLSGVGIGDTEEEVYDTYGDRIESGPPLFNRSPVHFLTYIPRHPADQDYRLRFKTDGNVVQSIYAGYEDSTEVVEGGCN